MKNDSSLIDFTDELFVKIRNFIETQTGLFFKEDRKKYLEKKVRERIGFLNITNIAGYSDLITSSSTYGRNEFQTLLENLTTRETSFFRNPDHFEALEKNILPQLIKEKARLNNRSIRFWSAGCSSGEEPYSLALLLLKLIAFPETWDIQIFATDISRNAIEEAKIGIYHENQLNPIPGGLKKKYFDKVYNSGTEYQVAKNVRKRVRFQNLNLMNQVYLSNFDIIFCRNVIIYFSEKTILNLIDYFYQCLKPGGFLFLGYSESLHKVKSNFMIKKIGNALVFQKGVK